ncbi:MAG: apolipoprotein N-acyltransferase [Treponema sp.]|nr:apolipoprotein N-acyltransferase [Treponema sp.]
MERRIKHSLENLALLVAAVILFAASFPNLVFPNGLPLLVWIAYVPVFCLVRRAGFALTIFWGAFYGYAAYGLFNYWLSVFHPLAGLIVGSIYLAYLAVLFPFLRFAALLFPRRGYILQWLLWMAFEYLRTQGFLGYSYGITGYSQWKLLPLIQIANITGVWGVSALVVFASAWLAAAISEALNEKQSCPKIKLNHGGHGETRSNKGNFSFSSVKLRVLSGYSFFNHNYWTALFAGFKAFFRREWVPAMVWAVLLAATLAYGFISPVDYSDARRVKFALIQHNTDPWEASKAPTHALELAEFRKDFIILSRLSDEALTAYPDIDLVVWSETAFVPRIYWHQTIRDDSASWELVKELLDYLGKKDVPFVIGNDDARRDRTINPVWDHRVDYNAVMLFEKGELKTLYRKLHLVPFTEHFPYEKTLPWIYRALKNADTHFWEKGEEATVFNSRGVKFSTPICFEDTFGYISRDFVRNGAELIVNLSNDAWSGSVPAQMQHLSMAVFRAVENRRSMVRSTSSGQTAAIDPNGRILAMAEPFTESYLYAEVPVVTPSTLYTRYGDYLGKAFTGAAFLVLIAGLILNIMKRRNIKKTGKEGFE